VFENKKSDSFGGRSFYGGENMQVTFIQAEDSKKMENNISNAMLKLITKYKQEFSQHQWQAQNKDQIVIVNMKGEKAAAGI
jgi:hypothetical protein